MDSKKVKNIIKGYASKFNIEEITVFDTDEAVVYSGSYEKFMNIKEEDGFLWEEWKRILNADCKKCVCFNNSKLFVFLLCHECHDCRHHKDIGCEYGYMYVCGGKQWEHK